MLHRRHWHRNHQLVQSLVQPTNRNYFQNFFFPTFIDFTSQTKNKNWKTQWRIKIKFARESENYISFHFNPLSTPQIIIMYNVTHPPTMSFHFNQFYLFRIIWEKNPLKLSSLILTVYAIFVEILFFQKFNLKISNVTSANETQYAQIINWGRDDLMIHFGMCMWSVSYDKRGQTDELISSIQKSVFVVYQCRMFGYMSS